MQNFLLKKRKGSLQQKVGTPTMIKFNFLTGCEILTVTKDVPEA